MLFYNKNAFRKAGLDPEQAPKTWFEMQGMLDQYGKWSGMCLHHKLGRLEVHIDNVSAVSGFLQYQDKLFYSFNGLPQVKHVAMIIPGKSQVFFVSFGRGGEANQQFIEGKCAMITTNS